MKKQDRNSQENSFINNQQSNERDDFNYINQSGYISNSEEEIENENDEYEQDRSNYREKYQSFVSNSEEEIENDDQSEPGLYYNTKYKTHISDSEEENEDEKHYISISEDEDETKNKDQINIINNNQPNKSSLSRTTPNFKIKNIQYRSKTGEYKTLSQKAMNNMQTIKNTYKTVEK